MTERDRQFAYEHEYSRLRQAAFEAGFEALRLTSFKRDHRHYVGYTLLTTRSSLAEATVVAGDSWTDAFEKAHKEICPAGDRLLARIAHHNTDTDNDSDARHAVEQSSWLRRQQL